MASLCVSQNNFAPYPVLSSINSIQQTRRHTVSTKVLGTSNLNNIDTTSNMQILTKRKLPHSHSSYGDQLPSVARRNARERNRVKQVNNGFANLRQHIPQAVINCLSNGGRGASKKLSKVDTLRIAVEYIRGLQNMLDKSKNLSKRNLSDESSNDSSICDYSTLGSPQFQTGNFYNINVPVSPTPSFTDSDISIGSCNYFETMRKEHNTHEQLLYSKNVFIDDQPDDEELLDYISSWQEQ